MKLTFVFMIMILGGTGSFSQIQWTKFSDLPLLSMDPASGMWGAYGQPTVILHNDTLKMWYGVAEGADPYDYVPKGRIHFAWSLDGLSWQKYGTGPVLDVGGPGAWDGQWLDTPEILWDGTEFKLYYYGDSTYQQGQDNTAIGLATSSDGIHWERQGKVLQKGGPGEWDARYIESPAAYFDKNSGVYALWYMGMDAVGWVKMGLAVSADGFEWMKHPSNPVMSVGPYPSWNDIAVAVPAVIETEGVFEMWYSGISFDQGQYDTARIGYAVSLNGIDWIQYPKNPVLAPTPEDHSSYWSVDVIWDEKAKEYKMYYEDFWQYGDPQNPDKVNAIFVATAPRDVLFSDQCLVSVSRDTIVTGSGSVQLWATGGTDYQWYPADGLSDPHIPNPMAHPEVTTMYKVLIVSESCITLDSVLITVQPSGLSEQKSIDRNSVKVYPNPFSEAATFELDHWSAEPYFLTIFDLFGNEVMHMELKEQKTELSGKDLLKGMYIFHLVKNGIEVNSGKFIVH